MNKKRRKADKSRQEEQGFVLVIGVLIMSFLLLLAVPFLFQLSTEYRLTDKSYKSSAALSLAEAGVERAIWEMNYGDISSWNGDSSLRTMTISDFQSSGGDLIGDIEIKVENPDAGNPVIESTGSVAYTGSQEITRTVRLVLRHIHPIPAPENAINIFGSPSKHAKVKIMEHDKKHQGEILVSGLNAGWGSDKLALGVEDAGALDEIIEELGNYLKGGGDLEDTLVGDPMNTYTDKKGNTFTASIGQVDSQGFDADFMEEIAQQLADNARSMTPTETIDLGGKEKYDEILDPDGDGMVQLGGWEFDVIYMTNGKLKLKKELIIDGTGTLIIDGAKLELDKATFNWDGDIYILGDEKKGDAQFKVKHAEVDINGDIFLLGSDNGKVKLDFHNDDAKHDGYTKIVGSILAMGGTGDKSKAELKVHHGDLDIEGFITMSGTKTKLDIHQHEPKNGESDIRIEGGICMLVPEANKKKKEKAEIKLHARGGGEGDFVIQYNSDIVEAAVQRLSDKLGLEDRFSIISWQEKLTP